MKTIQSSLTGIYQNGSASCLEFDHPLQAALQPGQFMLARGKDDILPIPLYPCGMQGFQYTSPLDGMFHWSIGDMLSISLPHGKGFDFNGKSKRLLMISVTSTPLRLFPLAGWIIQEGGEAALYTNHLPEIVSPEIELLTREQLTDAVTWADSIIGDLSLEQMTAWKQLLTGSGSRVNQNHDIQILIDTPLVCAGRAECGVCAVKTRHGWKQACTNGPVFQFSDLEV